MSFFPQYPGLQLLAATPITGFALQNGTPSILGPFTMPNDGAMHRIFVITTQHTTVTGVGGRCNITGTTPDGTGALAVQVAAAGQSVGTNQAGANILVQPGTQYQVVQATALTSGAETVWFELWGS